MDRILRIGALGALVAGMSYGWHFGGFGPESLAPRAFSMGVTALILAGLLVVSSQHQKKLGLAAWLVRGIVIGYVAGLGSYLIIEMITRPAAVINSVSQFPLKFTLVLLLIPIWSMSWLTGAVGALLTVSFVVPSDSVK